MPFIAYISCFRNSGRPDQPIVAEGESAEDVDAMLRHNGNFSFVGTYDTEDEALEAVFDYWDNHTVEDERGYVQWREPSPQE